MWLFAHGGVNPLRRSVELVRLLSDIVLLRVFPPYAVSTNWLCCG
jgi:hypothetical protein